MSTENQQKRGRRGLNPAADTTVDAEEMDYEEEENELAEAPDGSVNTLTSPKGRPTSGRRNRVRVQEEEQGNVITRRSSSVLDYVRGVRDELAKVTWPTREEVIRLGTIVISVTVVASIVLGLISFGFTVLFREGLRNPIVFVIFFAIVVVAGFFVTRAMRGDSSEPTYTSRL